jgi:hypothetical protein
LIHIFFDRLEQNRRGELVIADKPFYTYAAAKGVHGCGNASDRPLHQVGFMPRPAAYWVNNESQVARRLTG